MIMCLTSFNHRYLYFHPAPSQYAVLHSDGRPLYSDRRQVTLSMTTRLMSGRTETLADHKLMVRDDGIVHYEFIPSPQAEFIRINVSIKENMIIFKSSR